MASAISSPPAAASGTMTTSTLGLPFLEEDSCGIDQSSRGCPLVVRPVRSCGRLVRVDCGREAVEMSGTTDSPVPRRGGPGWIMHGEMAEQPAVLSRLLVEGTPGIRATARRIAARRPRFVLLCARGTSDHAALYAKYLLEVEMGLPCGLTSMSTTTAYGAKPVLDDVLVITVSQSGGSPDLVASTQAAAEAGAT